MQWWLQGFVWVLPAYVANMAPVFAAGLKTPLAKPIDGGAKAADGRRWLGNGKTWQGFAAAVLAGTTTGYLMSFFGLGSVYIGALLGFWAIFGDMVGSFAKRRLGMPRGANAGLLDRIDFITFALVAAVPFYPWELRQLLLVLIATPLLHRAANIIGYALKLKDVPW